MTDVLVPLKDFPRRFRYVSLLMIGWCALGAAHAADWPAITAEEKSMTSVPQVADAPAIILYREDTTDDTKNFHTVYIRLKILTDAGLKYADVEIPVGRSPFTISQLSGRTVHADGRIIGLEDQAVDKMVVRQHGVRMHVKAFSLPAVQVGSILDYRYSLHFPEGSRNAPTWMVQGELPVKKSIFKFVPTKYGGVIDSLRAPKSQTSSVGVASMTTDGANNYETIGTSVGGGNGEYSWVPFLPPGKLPEEHTAQQGIHQWIELQMNDVPPSPSEPDMPPPSVTNWHVDFFYSYTTKLSEYWKHVGKSWNRNIEDFLDRKKGISEAVNQLVAAGDPPETKARKIYAAISQMDSRSFPVGSDATSAPPPSADAEDVLQKRSGTHDELNRLFVAMARAAGIPATMMWVPDRGQTTFNANVMSVDQLDAEIVIVQLAGQDLFLDPATKFCPYGILNWHYAGTRGLRQSGDGDTTLAETPPPSYKQASIQRVARLQVTDQGAMDGTLAVGFSGLEAMVLRQQGASLDDNGRIKLLEEEVGGWLPTGAQVTLTNAPEWDKTEGMLVGKFKVTGPLAINSGQTWVMPVHIFQANQKPLFPSAQRASPVYFEYVSRQVDEVHIVLPPNVQAVTLPSNQQARTSYGVYTTEQKREGTNGVVALRDMAVNNVLFAPSEYKDLKNFYDAVAVGDSAEATLKGLLHAQNN